MTDPQTPTDLAPITDLELTQLETLVKIPKRMNPIFLKMLAEIRQSRALLRTQAQRIAMLETGLASTRRTMQHYLIKGDEALFERAEAAEARAARLEARVGDVPLRYDMQRDGWAGSDGSFVSRVAVASTPRDWELRRALAEEG